MLLLLAVLLVYCITGAIGEWGDTLPTMAWWSLLTLSLVACGVSSILEGYDLFHERALGLLGVSMLYLSYPVMWSNYQQAIPPGHGRLRPLAGGLPGRQRPVAGHLHHHRPVAAGGENGLTAFPGKRAESHPSVIQPLSPRERVRVRPRYSTTWSRSMNPVKKLMGWRPSLPEVTMDLTSSPITSEGTMQFQVDAGWHSEGADDMAGIISIPRATRIPSFLQMFAAITMISGASLLMGGIAISQQVLPEGWAIPATEGQFWGILGLCLFIGGCLIDRTAMKRLRYLDRQYILISRRMVSQRFVPTDRDEMYKRIGAAVQQLQAEGAKTVTPEAVVKATGYNIAPGGEGLGRLVHGGEKDAERRLPH